MIEMALGRGTWRTLQKHVCTYMRIRKWVRGNATEMDRLFPMRPSTLGQFLNYFKNQKCRPTAAEQHRQTVLWLHRRFQIPSTDTPNSELIKSIIALIGPEMVLCMKDKRTYTIKSIVTMEKFVVDGTNNIVDRAIVGAAKLWRCTN